MRVRSGQWLACWAPALFHPRALQAGEVEVWRASLKGRPPLEDALSPDERRRAEAMGDRQVSFAAAEWVASDAADAWWMLTAPGFSAGHLRRADDFK